MDTSDTRPIMAATDFSLDGNAAVAYAAEYAARSRRSLTVLHVARAGKRSGRAADSGPAIRRLRDRARMVDLTRAVNRDHPDLTVTASIAVGDPADILVDRARHASVLVIGAQGRDGYPAMHWGSASNRVVSRADCPVVIVRADVAGRAPRAGRPVVVAGAAPADAAASAFATSLMRPGPAYVLTLRPGRAGPPGGDLPTTRLVIRVAAPTADLVAATARVAADHDAGLVVIGRDRHAWPFRLGAGSAVHELLDAVDCPLAVVDLTAPARPPVPIPPRTAVAAHTRA